jgi:hypothetical protein
MLLELFINLGIFNVNNVTPNDVNGPSFQNVYNILYKFLTNKLKWYKIKTV